MKRNCQNQKGFTIVELMISTVVFSTVLVLCLTGMVQVSRAYYKGITNSRTQEAGRLLLDEISQSIKLSGTSISVRPAVNAGPEVDVNDIDEGTGVFCVGNKKYTYALDRKVVNESSNDNENNKEIRNALISEDEQCTDVLTPADLNLEIDGTQKSLLSENMRLTKFTLERIQPDETINVKSGSQLWRIEISIAYGDQDLIRYEDDAGNARVTCNPGTGGEFCSIVELSTIVARRIS
jgi:prepilin-type N-terminal cleavage/methylation domain-containing protein